MSEYPATPRGWALLHRRRTGRFTTGVTFRNAEGATIEWSSRGHRKHASRLTRVRGLREVVLWAPHRASWWIAVLFIVGSACFVVAPLPAYLRWVGPSADGTTFFAGSLFFTAAAALQWLETINADRGPGTPILGRMRLVTWEPRRIDWWSSGIQLLGTVFFNLTTLRALTTAITNPSYDQVVWRPDAYGSVCFLISGYLAYVEVAGGLVARPPGTLEGSIVSVNLFGCGAFGIAAVAGYVLPSTDTDLDLTMANIATSVGALAFLAGAGLLLREGAKAAG